MRKNGAKVELGKELECTVLRQETIVNGYLKVIDELQLNVASLMDEVRSFSEKRLLNVAENVFNSTIKLKSFEETYSKTNTLLFSLCYSNKRRGDALVELIGRLKFLESKIGTLEEQLIASQQNNIRKQGTIPESVGSSMREINRPDKDSGFNTNQGGSRGNLWKNPAPGDKTAISEEDDEN